MLASIHWNIYIDPELVANECLQRCKVSTQKKENTGDALECWGLEHILETECLGIEMSTEFTLDDLVNRERETTEDGVLIDKD